MSLIYGNAIILPSKGENTSGGAGFKVTFPATATNWEWVNATTSGLFLSDGTIKPFHVYSNISG